MRGLNGKVAVIAGGGSGIGATTALRLASEGSSVVVGDLNGDNALAVANEIVDNGGKAIAVAFDISTEAGVDELISNAVSTFGGIDCVHVNAADLSPDTIMRDSDVESVPLEVFDRTIAVNLRGHLLTTRRVVPELLARGGGAIVYTSSAAAFVGEDTRPSYAMSKAGLGALVRHVASKWGREGIRANAVAPGLILTEAVLANPDPQLREFAIQMGHSNRPGRPDDIAAAVAFLFSDDGGWIVGQVIGVDGGALYR